MSAKTELTVSEASRILGLSAATVKRRLVSGELAGRKETRPQGTRWLVEVDTARINGSPQLIESSVNGDRELTTMADRIISLESQLTTKDQQIDQLHRLLAQTALNQAPARPWWRFWK